MGDPISVLVYGVELPMGDSISVLVYLVPTLFPLEPSQRPMVDLVWLELVSTLWSLISTSIAMGSPLC